jgi:hypothetical protein
MSFSVFEGEKIAYLRPILSIFAGLTYQELPGAYQGALSYAHFDSDFIASHPED